MKTPAIHIQHLYKSYAEVTALRDVQVEIQQGELFGFIGPDGAGKTTLFRIMTSLMLPDKGSVSVLGFDTVKDYKKIRENIGYMPGRFSLYQDLTVQENLSFFAGVHGTTIEENYDLIKDVYAQIEPFKNRPAGKLSGGMKQKLALSCALIHRPQVLFLDEPTTGVDAVSRHEFWLMLQKLKNSGITIVVSTPYMDEAALCDRVALMQSGKLLKLNRPQNIIEAFGHPLWAVKSNHMYPLLNDLQQYPQTLTAYRYGDTVHCVGNQTKGDTQAVEAFLMARNHQNLNIEKVLPAIEDCFILLMEQQNTPHDARA